MSLSKLFLLARFEIQLLFTSNQICFYFQNTQRLPGGQGGNSNQLLEVAIGQFQILIDNPGKEQ